MKYFILVGIEKDGTEEYEMLFGDYERDVVKEEKKQYRGQGDYCNLIVLSTGDSQSAINDAIHKLNNKNILGGDIK